MRTRQYALCGVRVAILFAALSPLLAPRPGRAYVEAPYPLGRVITESTNIVVMRLEKVDKEKNLLIYRKVRDLKGTHPGETIKHNIAHNGFQPREWQNVMAWAEVGKTAVFFHNGAAGECCIDNYWYQVYPGDWWNMSHAEPYLLRSYAGKADKLIPAVEAILAGQEVTVPCMVDGDKEAIQRRIAKLQRIKASLKIQDYDPKRDFAGWGVEEFRALAGWPAFSQYGALAKVDPGAIGVVPVDFDGDGKVDLLMYGAAHIALLQNAGGSYNDVHLPIVGGARGAAWADYNGDGKPDLLLATPTGPKLFTNLGEGKFKDDSAGLPTQPYFNLTAAAFIDRDGTGKPDILLADGFNGLRLWRNVGSPAAKPLVFEMGKWMQCGPFDNTGNKGFDTAYPPEQKIDLGAEYPGKNGQKAKWQENPAPDGQLNSVKLYREQDHTYMVVYLYREITCNQAAEVPIGLGGGGALAVWLNGQKVLSDNKPRQPAPDSVKVMLKLKPGKNALLVKACYVEHGREYYFKATPPTQAVTPLFEDVSDKVGLGTAGVGGRAKGDGLIVADINGDGRPDFLYSAGNGVVVLNMPNGFVESKDSGITFKAGGVTPLFLNLDGAAKRPPDLFIPQRGGCKLLRNDGKGHFTDVTAKSGALAQFTGDATSAAVADFTGKGHPDLVVGCMHGPNRVFRPGPNGTFTDIGDQIGLYQRQFNTRAMAVIDFNKDGAPDIVFVNEGQESALLLGRQGGPAAQTASGQ